ncbi:hypothetical protein VTI74DRAFT_7977 [Chaetomium olivicolor]
MGGAAPNLAAFWLREKAELIDARIDVPVKPHQASGQVAWLTVIQPGQFWNQEIAHNDEKHYEKGDCLGSGTYGEVYKVKSRHNNGMLYDASYNLNNYELHIYTEFLESGDVFRFITSFYDFPAERRVHLHRPGPSRAL